MPNLARPHARNVFLPHRAYTVIPDAMRVKGEDMQERREMNGNGPFQCGMRNERPRQPAFAKASAGRPARPPFGCAQGRLSATLGVTARRTGLRTLHRRPSRWYACVGERLLHARSKIDHASSRVIPWFSRHRPRTPTKVESLCPPGTTTLQGHFARWVGACPEPVERAPTARESPFLQVRGGCGDPPRSK